ncbi:MAG: hypothetical protein R3C68_05890 [Myxococcota bacterium]
MLAVPATAAVYAPWVVMPFTWSKKSLRGETKTVTQTFVDLGERRGDFVAVRSGLTKGQTIVSTGAFKLSNGVSVVVQNEKPLDPQLKPEPENE